MIAHQVFKRSPSAEVQQEVVNSGGRDRFIRGVGEGAKEDGPVGFVVGHGAMRAFYEGGVEWNEIEQSAESELLLQET